MPISQVQDPSDNPETLADWQKISNIFQTTWLAITGSLKIVSGNIQKGSAVNIGGKWYVATANTAITGTASEYVRLTASAGSVIAEYVENLTDVFWSQSWNGFYDALGRVYVFDEVKAFADGAISLAQTIVNWRPRNAEVAKILSQMVATGWASMMLKMPTPGDKTYQIVGTGGNSNYRVSKQGSGFTTYFDWLEIGTVSVQTLRGVTATMTSLRIQADSVADFDLAIWEGESEPYSPVYAVYDADDLDAVFTLGGTATGTARVLRVFAKIHSTLVEGTTTWQLSGAVNITDPNVVDDYCIKEMGRVLN